MSHWLAWHGQPLLIEQLLFNPRGGLVDHAHRSGQIDDAGFGLGWYGTGADPDVYHASVAPWEDASLRELAGNVSSPLFLAHIGPGPGSAMTQHGRWLFVLDGAINGFGDLESDLLAAVDPSLRGTLGGSSQSELLFALALTFGLPDDPVAGLERAIGFVEAIAVRRGVGSAVRASIGLSDGESVWAVRYCTRGPAPPLFTSADVQAARMLYPNRPLVQLLKDDDHIVVSHPLADIPGAWDKLPEASAVMVRAGRSERLMFRPSQSSVAGDPIGG